jgi:hypothetical protein
MKTLTKASWFILLFQFISFIQYTKSQTNFVYGKQFGSGQDVNAISPVTDQFGNVYMAGFTFGTIAGQSYGKTDGFISKYDSTGNTVWMKQFGTNEEDRISCLTIDDRGNLYVVGNTKGTLIDKSFGNDDIIVIRFDTSGTIQWQKQFGSDSSDVGNSIVADNKGNIYVSAKTKGLMGKTSFGKTDCILIKLDNKGNIIWTDQFGTTDDDDCIGINGDNASNIYVSGYTKGDLASRNKGHMDALIGKFTDNGEQVKVIQFGTEAFDVVSNLVIDKDKFIYASGSTGGDLGGKQQGSGDSFLSKLNENLEILWTRQFGTNKWDGINGMALNEKVSEDIVVSGCQNWPSCQAFVRIYKKDGSLLWSNNYIASGKNGGTCGKGVCIDNKGNIYHTGNTGANLFGSASKSEGHDVYLIKLSIDNSQTDR